MVLRAVFWNIFPNHSASMRVYANGIIFPCKGAIPMTAERLQAFVTASEQSDIDAIMSFIHDDCLYITTTGSAPGTEFHGKEAIRTKFLEILADAESEVTYGPLYVSGNRGTVEWQVRTPRLDGSHTLMRGVDLFEFQDDLIIRKDAFRKVMV
jgi:hypothetical protein